MRTVILFVILCLIAVFNTLSVHSMQHIVLEKHPSKNSQLPTLSQDDFRQENTIYVIKYDFDLNGKNIHLPSNCMLEFEGGTLSGGRLTGTVLNDFLNVKDFVKDDIIDEALENIYSICNSAYLPKGEFKLNKTYSFESSKKLYGCGLESKIILSPDSYFLINRKENVIIEDINILLDKNSSEPAINIDGMRYCRFGNINIRSSIAFNNSNSQTGILLRQSLKDNDYYGSTLSSFYKITISHVKYGIVLDSTVKPQRDYITSCTFSDILIYAFVDSGVVIKGKRIYANTFNNLTIQDAYSSNLDRKGIDFGGSSGDFQGGYSNFFNNLTIWADAKGGNNTFYALYLSSDASVINSPTHITGSIEGLIGSPASEQAKWIFLSHLKYNVILTLVDSKTKELTYFGRLSNYILNEASDFVNLMDTGYFVNNCSSSASSCEIKTNSILFSSESLGTISAKVQLPYSIEKGTKLKLLAQIETDGNAEMKILGDGEIFEYKSIKNVPYLDWTNTKRIVSDEVKTIEVELNSRNATYLKVKNIFLVSYTSSKESEFPWYIFTNAEQLFQQMRRLHICSNYSKV